MNRVKANLGNWKNGASAHILMAPFSLTGIESFGDSNLVFSGVLVTDAPQ